MFGSFVQPTYRGTRKAQQQEVDDRKLGRCCRAGGDPVSGCLRRLPFFVADNHQPEDAGEHHHQYVGAAPPEWCTYYSYSSLLRGAGIRPFRPARTTECEPPLSCATNAPDNETATVQQELRQAKIQGELDELRAAAAAQERKDPSSCPSCLYVGVATSLGLAAYFAHAALEEVVVDEQKILSQVARKQQQQQRYNKPVFLAISIGWLGIGAYRWHLG